jgi:CHASE1-domain containing sensor protein
VSAWEERLAKAKFTALASDYATVLQTGLDEYLAKILAVRAFYDASNSVDADEFALFTKQITQGYEDSMRLVWSPRVTDDERDLFEREARASGLSDFSIRTWSRSDAMAVSPPREEYYPILYSTVSSKRMATFGTDVNSEPIRSEAIRRAIDGNTIATAQGILLRNPIMEMREAFLAVSPTYRHGQPYDTIEDRRRNTLGVIVGAFPTSAVFDSILRSAKLPQTIDLYLYPTHAGADGLPVYMRVAASRDQPLEAKPETALAEPASWSASLKAGDAGWKLVVLPEQEGLIGYYRAWLVLPPYSWR